MKKILFIALLAGIFSSCSHRYLDFTVVSTRNYDIQKGQVLQKNNYRTNGSSTAHMILCFPTGYPNLKDAIDRALDKTPGAIGLADGVVYYKSWWAILYGQNKFVVEGTPIIDTELVENQKAPSSDSTGEALYVLTTSEGNTQIITDTQAPETSK